jgi:hypothetical protein
LHPSTSAPLWQPYPLLLLIKLESTTPSINNSCLAATPTPLPRFTYTKRQHFSRLEFFHDFHLCEGLERRTKVLEL